MVGLTCGLMPAVLGLAVYGHVGVYRLPWNVLQRLYVDGEKSMYYVGCEKGFAKFWVCVKGLGFRVLDGPLCFGNTHVSSIRVGSRSRNK